MVYALVLIALLGPAATAAVARARRALRVHLGALLALAILAVVSSALVLRPCRGQPLRAPSARGRCGERRVRSRARAALGPRPRAFHRRRTPGTATAGPTWSPTSWRTASDWSSPVSSDEVGAKDRDTRRHDERSVPLQAKIRLKRSRTRVTL